MARKKPLTGECVYCGRWSRLTVDHIPPRGLFSKNNRDDLVRVPSCEPCNGNSSKDDEYLRVMVSMRHDVTGTPDAREAWAASLRGFARPEKQRMRAATQRSITRKERFKGSIYLGRAPAYNVDLSRLCRPIERIVRGLYWSEFGKRLPGDYEVATFSLDMLDSTNIQTQIWISNLADAALRGRLREVGGQAFRYAFIRDSQDERVSLWMIQIYVRVYFFAITKPIDSARGGD